MWYVNFHFVCNLSLINFRFSFLWSPVAFYKNCFFLLLAGRRDSGVRTNLSGLDCKDVSLGPGRRSPSIPCLLASWNSRHRCCCSPRGYTQGGRCASPGGTVQTRGKDGGRAPGSNCSFQWLFWFPCRCLQEAALPQRGHPHYRRNHRKPGRRPKRLRGVLCSQAPLRAPDEAWSQPPCPGPTCPPVVRGALQAQAVATAGPKRWCSHEPCPPPLLQKAFPPHRPRGQVLVTERRSGQGLGPRGGGCIFSVPPGAPQSRECPAPWACHCRQPLWHGLPALRGRPALWQHPALPPGRAFSPPREVGPVALRKLQIAMSVLWPGLCGHQLPPDWYPWKSTYF